MNKNPSPSYDQDEGQIACALRGVEKDESLLHKKIKVCLDWCKKDISNSCPPDCFCVWTIESKDSDHVRQNREN